MPTDANRCQPVRCEPVRISGNQPAHPVPTPVPPGVTRCQSYCRCQPRCQPRCSRPTTQPAGQPMQAGANRCDITETVCLQWFPLTTLLSGDRLDEFLATWWPRLSPGGFVLIHSTVTNQHSRGWLDRLRSQQQPDGGAVNEVNSPKLLARLICHCCRFSH